MARSVKCCLTGEIGTKDTFIKIGTKYYKSQEIYDKDHREKELWTETVRFICEDLLGYQTGQVFPALVTKKLKEYTYYNREVVLKAFQDKAKDILYFINQDGKFENDISKIHYMFAIIKNSINDIHRDWKRAIKQDNKIDNNEQYIEIISDNISTNQKGKDLSMWLEDD